MFDLEQSISEWRRQMLSAGVRNPDIVDELESHLRDDWERRVEAGESDEQALESAVQGVGQASLLKREFAKLGGKKWAWLERLGGIMAGVFAPVPDLSTWTPGARWTLELARQEAPRRHHGFIGTEHVLLGLLALEEGVVPNIFRKMGVDREDVRRQIENWVSDFPLSKIPARIPYTPRVRKSLCFAAREARVSRNSPVGAEHLLLGLVLEGDGVAGRVLRDFGFSPETTREEIRREEIRREEIRREEIRREEIRREEIRREEIRREEIRREAGQNRRGAMDEELEKRLRFLRQANTEGMPHSDCALLDHLLGTRQLLVEWEARPALCDAGLFHSVYGTDHYELKAVPLTMRNEVQQLIGGEAESLVWLFCTMRRETLFDNLKREGEFRVQHRLTDEWLPLTAIQFQDLFTLTLANTLEAFLRCSWYWRRYLSAGLGQYRDVAIPPAQRTIDRISIRWWEIWK